METTKRIPMVFWCDLSRTEEMESSQGFYSNVPGELVNLHGEASLAGSVRVDIEPIRLLSEIPDETAREVAERLMRASGHASGDDVRPIVIRFDDGEHDTVAFSDVPVRLIEMKLHDGCDPAVHRIIDSRPVSALPHNAARLASGLKGGAA